MRIVIATYGDTLKVYPLVKKDRFPDIRRVEVIDNITYAILNDIFGTKLPLGTIPPEYKMISKDKYEIVFKTKTPRKVRLKKYSK